MSRERTGFVVVQVWATICYEDTQGHSLKIQKAVAAGPQHNLTESRKRELKVKQAKQIIRDTIADLKSQGMTNCKGSVDTRYYARVGYKDEQGKRRDFVRAADSIADAQQEISNLLEKLKKQGGLKTLQAEGMTFADLATYFEKHYLKPAKYVDGKKVSGACAMCRQRSQAILRPAPVAVDHARRPSRLS